MSFDDYDEGLNEPEYEVSETEFREGLKEEGLDEKEINELLEDENSWSNREDPMEEWDRKHNDFENAKQRLRDKQENIYEDPDKIYVEIKIPEKGVVGEDCVIKFSKKVPFAQMAISQKLEWKKRDRYQMDGKKELVSTAFIQVEAKDCTEIRHRWEDMSPFRGVPTNLLNAGEYLVEGRGWSKGAYEETTSRRLIKVTKNG
jgi:hypothetical protein